MSQFVCVTPTDRNAPPCILLNAHHIHRLQEDSRGVIIILQGANAEHLHIGEQSFAVAHAMKADGKAGKITLHELVEMRPVHQMSFDLADIRAVEQTTSGGSVIRHGLDGSGRFEAFEPFDTIERMINKEIS